MYLDCGTADVSHSAAGPLKTIPRRPCPLFANVSRLPPSIFAFLGTGALIPTFSRRTSERWVLCACGVSFIFISGERVSRTVP